METDNSDKANSFNFPIHASVALGLAIVILIIAYLVKAPENATIGYHFLSILIPLISYSIIFLVVSAIIAALLRKFKSLTFVLFSWLILGAAVFDSGVGIYKLYLMSQLNSTFRRIEQKEGKPINQVLEEKIAESNRIKKLIEERGLKQEIERSEGKRIEQIPIKRLKEILELKGIK